MAWLKKRAHSTPEMLHSASSERDVVSCQYGADLKGRGMIFKFALRNGQSEAVDIAPALALGIASDIENSARRFKYDDVRCGGGIDHQIAAIDNFKKVSADPGRSRLAREKSYASGSSGKMRGACVHRFSVPRISIPEGHLQGVQA